MVWSYHSVEELRKKYEKGEEISAAEKRKLEKYIRRKKKMEDVTKGSWSTKQLRRAELLLHKITKDEEKIEVKQ